MNVRYLVIMYITCLIFNLVIITACFIINFRPETGLNTPKPGMSCSGGVVLALSLEGLCVEAISLHFFKPSFGLTNLDGRLLHTWPFGQEEVQLREFVSTLHVKPLSGPGNLAADEPHEHSESCTTPFSNSKVALASSARFAPSCMPRNRLRVMSQHCLRGKGGL